MRTIVCERPHHFMYKEAETPRPAKHEALIQIKRVGICGTDIHAFQGNQPFFEYPRILGHELCGEIVALPETEQVVQQHPNHPQYSEHLQRSQNPDQLLHRDVQRLNVGDRVSVIPYLECGQCVACLGGKTNCCMQLQVLGVHRDGGMRDYFAVPVDHLVQTNDLSSDQTSIVECLGIGAHAVARANIQPGETALVIGAGPIGLGVMKFARLAGARVVAMDLDEERLHFCKKWVPADGSVRAQGDSMQALSRLTGGHMPTVVFDATGNKASMHRAFDFVAFGGRLIYVGLFKGDVTFHDPHFHQKELTLMASRNATRKDFMRVIDAIRGGQIDTDAFITHRTTFERMIDDFQQWIRPGSGVIKAVIEM